MSMVYLPDVKQHVPAPPVEKPIQLDLCKAPWPSARLSSRCAVLIIALYPPRHHDRGKQIGKGRFASHVKALNSDARPSSDSEREGGKWHGRLEDGAPLSRTESEESSRRRRDVDPRWIHKKRAQFRRTKEARVAKKTASWHGCKQALWLLSLGGVPGTHSSELVITVPGIMA